MRKLFAAASAAAILAAPAVFATPASASTAQPVQALGTNDGLLDADLLNETLNGSLNGLEVLSDLSVLNNSNVLNDVLDANIGISELLSL